MSATMHAEGITHDEYRSTRCVLASQAMAAHTAAVRDWLVAAADMRAWHWGQIEAAWREVRYCCATSQASAAATGLMMFNGKLKGLTK